MTGYGYLREYRLEQTFRDARIAAIYEGANGIHERSLATRLLSTGAGDAFLRFAEYEVQGDDAGAQILSMWTEDRKVADDARAHDFAGLSGCLLLCVMWRRTAARAEDHPDPARIRRLAEAAALEVRARAAMHHTLMTADQS